MSARVRWGILGTGHAARNFAEGLRVLPEAKLAAAGSRDAARAAVFSAAYKARPCGSYEELVGLSDIDVVYVATTPDRHREDCLLCLNAGKPVLCEKPFALDARQAREIVNAARSKRLFC